MIITYTALRSLVTDHVAGDQYVLNLGTTQRTRSRRVEKVQQKSLSGRLETLWYYADRNWAVTFVPVRAADVLALQEFLDSTESGEAFTMTLLGETNPAVTVKRTDEGYTLNTFMELGALAADWFTASIEVVEQ